MIKIKEKPEKTKPKAILEIHWYSDRRKTTIEKKKGKGGFIHVVVRASIIEHEPKRLADIWNHYFVVATRQEIHF